MKEVVWSNWEIDCRTYLNLNKQVKDLTELIAPIKKRLKESGDCRSDKYQVSIAKVESFRLKSFKHFFDSGHTKEKLLAEGLAGFSQSERMAVTEL